MITLDKKTVVLIGMAVLAALFWGLWAGFYVLATPYATTTIAQYLPDEWFNRG